MCKITIIIDNYVYGGLKMTSFCVRDSSMHFDFFYCQSDSQSILGHPVKTVPWAVLYIFSITDFVIIWGL